MSNENNPYGATSGGDNYQMNYQGTTTQPSQNAPQQASNPAPSGETDDITTAQFGPQVVEASKTMPVLVDFWAPWCGPCKQLAPALEKVASEYAGQIKLVKMNIDDHPEIPGQMGIQSIPAVVAFVDGKPADAFMGVQSETQIKAFVEKLAGPPIRDDSEDILKEAKEKIAANELTGAMELVAGLLQRDEKNPRAMALLGSIYLKNNDVERAVNIADAIDDEHSELEEVAGLTAALELAQLAADVGDLDQLRAQVDADPKDWQAKFDLAIALNATGEREEAADFLLEIISQNRQWNEDGARLQLLQFFEAWGNTDPATLSARRKLSSALFS